MHIAPVPSTATPTGIGRLTAPHRTTRHTRPVAYRSRVAAVLVGFVLIGLGDAFMVSARFGSSPLGSVNVALAALLRLPVGTIAMAVGLVLALIATGLTRRRPGKITIAAPVICGATVNAVLPHLAPVSLGQRILAVTLGLVLIGAGAGIYIEAGLGRASVETMLTWAAGRFDRPLTQLMVGFQLLCLGVAVALRGRLGVATLAFPFASPAVTGAVMRRSRYMAD